MRGRTPGVLAALLLLGCSASAGPAGTPGPARAEPSDGLLAPFERRVAPFGVEDSAGRAYTFPFIGGTERPRPQLVDIDGDGDLDLFVQEFTGQMSFFERVDSPGTARYVWRTDQYQDLDIGEWSRFVDLDGDGDVDLLAEEPFSYIRWYRNDGGPTRPAFTLAADTLRDVSGTPIFADRQNIPRVADLDCNGRLDLFLGRVDGTITRYEMRSLDPAAGPRFELVTQRFEDIQIIGGDAAPDAAFPLPQVPGAGGPVPQRPSLHGANTMAVVDVDGDGDQDILWGDFFEPGILWIRNTGSCAAPSMRGTPVPFPTGDPLKTSGYNAPAVADMDGDGDLDLLVGVLGGAYDPSRTSRENLHYLEQTAPGVYATRTTRYLDGIDVGSESVPALVDLDGDGDLDLVLGNKIEPYNSSTAGLYVFENRGTPSAPVFRRAGRIPAAAGFHYAPTFADLDADGDPDLILGTWRDAVVLYRNDGTRATPRFVPADTLVRLTRGSHTTPALADMDGDGDLDLVVGEGSGSLNYYRNEGSRTTPRFVLESDEYLGLRAGRRSVPRFADLDGDGDHDLIVGTEAGPPLVLRNAGTRTTPDFEPDSAGAAALWPPYSAPVFGDLDGDGDLDVLLGNSSGGVQYLESRITAPAPAKARRTSPAGRTSR